MPIEGLPAELANHEALKDFNTPADLAKAYVQSRTADWRSGLSEPLRAEKSFEGFKGVEDLAKSFLDTKKMVGARVHIGPDAKPEEIEKVRPLFLKLLGLPESPEKYEITRPKDAPDGLPYDEAREKAFLAQAHKLGLTKAQAQGILDFYNADMIQFFKDAQVLHSKATEKLKEEWGESYPKNKALAQRAFLEMKDPELEQLLTTMNLDNHPAIVRAFFRIGEMMAEHSLIEGEGLGTMSAEEAAAKLAEMMKDPKGALFDANHAGHAAAVAERTKLLNILGGGKKWEMPA